MKGRTLTRADLCEAVHEEVGLTRQDCAGLIERTLDLIAEALESGAAVKLSGFGVFQVRAKRERMGRNPKTGEPAAIEPRRVIGFRASQVMKARVDRALSREGSASPRVQGPGSLSDDLRGGRRAERAPACSALLGNQVRLHPADEARRRA